MAYDKTWSDIIKLSKESEYSIQIYETNTKKAEYTLNKLQITTHSVLGSVINFSSGITIDNWIRVLGSTGMVKNRDILSWNTTAQNDTVNHFSDRLIVADDAIGGIFAMDLSPVKGKKGEIWYFAPDSLQWENLNIQYSEFIPWTFGNGMEQFYQGMRWSNWRNDVKTVGFNEGILIYPFLWSKECDIETADKKIVSIEELYKINFEYSDII